MPAEPSIIGRCPECCACPAPVITWRSRSASKTKVGYDEFAGFVSVPPKVYLTAKGVTYAETRLGKLIGGVASYDATAPLARYSWGGSCNPATGEVTQVQKQEMSLTTPGTTVATKQISYNSATGTTTTNIDDGTVVTSGRIDYTNEICGGGVETAFAEYNKSIVANLNLFSGTASSGVYRESNFPAAAAVNGWIGVAGLADYLACGEWVGCPFTDDASLLFFVKKETCTLTNEYDNTLLRTNTIAALPADWPNTTAGSYRNLTTDERTLSIREGSYQWAFKVPKVGSGQCYGLDWIERFTPAGGGAAVDVERNWEWDREIPEGYDPEDPETWPVTPWFDIEIPATNGTTLVLDVVAYCRDCAT